METVPRAWVDGFADSLEMISDEMRRRLSDELAKIDYDMPVAYVRERLVAIMQAYCYESRTMAAQAAAEFYDGLRQLQLGERMGAVVIDGYNPVAVERRVRSAIEPLAKAQRLVEGPVGEFWADAGTKEERDREATRRAARELCKALVEYQGYGIKSAAGGTVFGNGARDGRRVRFARIPRGSKHYPNGCPFCQMLASRGFVYRSELAAGGLDPDHYHSDCQCMVVPSWGPGSVEGYDPSDYDEGYKEYLAQDHSEHDRHVAETQRNRYDAMGRLKSGDGNRVDEKGALTDEDRALVRSKRTAKGNETRRADRSRMFYGLGVTENEWKAMSEAEQAALLEAHGARAVSSGERYNDLWLSQFEPEVATVSVFGREVYRHAGTPNSSSFPEALPDGLSYSDADLHHTHTTPISGTFSDVDINTTVSTGCSTSGITHTLTGREYKLTRTPSATAKSMEDFNSAFQAFYANARYEAECDYWDEYYAESSTPLDAAGRRQALANVQPIIDAWLHENAGKYGYKYDS